MFEKALAAGRGRARAPTQIVLVRGRVDHKEAGKVCVDRRTRSTPFDPSEAEIEKAKAQVAELAAARRRGRCACASTPRRLPATVIDELRELFERYPGESEFVLEMHTRTGPAPAASSATTTRSPARNAALKAELEPLLGAARLAGVPQPA